MTPFLAWFEESKKLFGICPCCGELFRLSDVNPFTETPPPPTPFDILESQEARLKRRVDAFDLAEEEIRYESRLRGQRKFLRRLRKIAPELFSWADNLKDVKVLFHPVDYLVFKGLARENCSAIQFVDHPAETKQRERIQTSMAAAIQAGRVDWQTFRVEDDWKVVPDTEPVGPEVGA